jgi:hypothetical protein
MYVILDGQSISRDILEKSIFFYFEPFFPFIRFAAYHLQKILLRAVSPLNYCRLKYSQEKYIKKIRFSRKKIGESQIFEFMLFLVFVECIFRWSIYSFEININFSIF